MVFKFDLSLEESLTQDNNDIPHCIELLPGNYSPYCLVEGGYPLAEVKIMMGETQMPGRMNIENKTATHFVADEVEFKG